MTFHGNEAELRQAFLEFLKREMGYPGESLLQEYALPAPPGQPKRHADIIVTDPDSARTLALVELKVHETTTTQEDAMIQVRMLLDLLGTPVPAFLVMNSFETPSGFQIFSLEDGNQWREIPRHEFPMFRALASRARADQEALISRERRVRFDVLTTSCYAGALVLLLLFLLSVWDVFSPSKVQLGMLGGAIALVVLPNAARLKALGFEFERLKKDK